MRLLALAIVLSYSGSAVAQENSVLMRRPLPGFSYSDSQTSVPPGTTTPDTWSPPTNDPSLPDLPADEVQYAYWVVGAWQGASSCGTQGTVTRDVTCMGLSAHINDAGDAYDFSYQGPVKPSFCADMYGYTPDAKLEGPGAGCTYTYGLDNFGPWSNTCGYGSRQGEVACFKNGTEKVDTKYCSANPTNGGTEQMAPYFTTEYGYNYTGCDYRWELGTPKSGACVDGFREIDHPNRYCVRYTPQGSSMGSVDPSFCGTYEKSRMACSSQETPQLTEVQPGDFGYDSCLNGSSPAYSVSTVYPPNTGTFNSVQQMMDHVCARGASMGVPCCLVQYSTTNTGEPYVSVTAWDLGPAPPKVEGTDRRMNCVEFQNKVYKDIGSQWKATGCTVLNQ